MSQFLGRNRDGEERECALKILGLIAKTYNDFDDILDDWVHEGWSKMQREN